ncbi:cysteine synthase A [Brevundimonas sp.]|uniref:cysteine synthase A n=1 Tax=Brevundimonas sp. TaxID=1871086 RepID=UPI0028A15F4D|nr:cysteine synthase A [Brevundimonas sp.]
MRVASDVLGLIGQTPLLRLKRASEETGCEILGKAEFLNAGQSIKDRAALSIILKARASGALKAGGTIVEGTAGNTGIGLAMVGAALGHPVVIVMPRTQTEEKKRAVRLHGAKLIEVDPAPFSSPNHFVHYSRRLAQELNETEPHGAFYADQFDNLSNRLAHYEGTGPEIWEQTGGKVDGFICAVGSGGTLVGTTTYLKEQNPDLKIGLADVPGAALYSFFKDGVLKGEGSSITEGIGVNRITGNLTGLDCVDYAYQIGDEELLSVLFDLVQHEGLCLGGSSGVNVAGAIRMAKEMGPGHTIVTVLCDSGQRYATKLYDPAYLRSRNLPTAEWMGQ